MIEKIFSYFAAKGLDRINVRQMLVYSQRQRWNICEVQKELEELEAKGLLHFNGTDWIMVV